MEHTAFLMRTYIEKMTPFWATLSSFSDVKSQDLKDSQKKGLLDVGMGGMWGWEGDINNKV